MIARGLGVDAVPAARDALYALVESGRCVPALPFDLTFPELFYPKGVPYQRHGFDAALSNPPWDRMLPMDKEFFASYEFAILDAPTKRERDTTQKRLTGDPRIKRAHDQYIEGFRGAERAVDTLYRHQVAVISGEKTIGKLDLFRLFMERMAELPTQFGVVGLVVPSAFHANEGATAIRRLYLEKMALRCCYSFENRRKLFEIHSSFKFALVVGVAGRSTTEFSCAFYLHDDEWLFNQRDGREPLRYTLDFVRRTGGEYMSLLELRSKSDLEVAEVCFAHGESFDRACNQLGLDLGRELNTTDDAWRCTPTQEVLPGGEYPRDPGVASRLLKLNTGYLVLHEGRTFHQFSDHWEYVPRYVVSIGKLQDRKNFLSNARFFRATYRTIAASTNERTAIFSLHPPGVITQDKNPTEHKPSERPNARPILLIAVANTYPFDFGLRIYVSSSTVNYFFLARAPFPRVAETGVTFAVHQGLRLICNHSGYAPLWQEQVGEAWREKGKPSLTWPVLAGDDERWAVRAAIDAVVADAYGLSRDQYAHVLSTFSHASYRKAPELCLARFDELKQIGLETFTRKHDPYWDIPLNENLPQPVNDLPIPGEATEGDGGGDFHLTGNPKQPKRRTKKASP